MNDEEDRKLFVGGLPQDCTQEELKVPILVICCLSRLHKPRSPFAKVGTLSVMSITLSYVFALSHNALALLRNVIAFSVADSDLFDPDPDPASHFDTDPDPAFQFDTYPDPYRFKGVMYLKQYFLYILTWFSLSVGPTGPNEKACFVQFSLPGNVVLIRVAYGSGSWKMIRILPDP
jgi:hypothetical protein